MTPYSLLCLALLAAGASASSFGIATLATVTGIVFQDRNGNGARDAGESGLGGIAVSDQVIVVETAADGSFQLATPQERGVIWVGVPDGFQVVGKFWRPFGPGAMAGLEFALAPHQSPAEFTFVHASDTHVSEASLPRIRRLRALVDSLRPAFVLLTGDLVRDALRVAEPEARGYYELVRRELAEFAVPVWTVPGNHELFGIERHLSLVPRDHPLAGRGMYRHYFGPDYYSFDYGGVHFVGLNTVDQDDLWYYGHVDSLQLAWLERDAARVRRGTSVVTFNHIPFYSAVEIVGGYRDDPPAPTLIRVGGGGSARFQFRHTVANASDVLARLRGHRYTLALGGHVHARETLVYQTGMPSPRFHQSAAVVGPNPAGNLLLVSGITLYRVRGGEIDEGRFIPLDPPALRP